VQKEDILTEIRRTAQENGGKPLGRQRFERVTGIKPYDWIKYWPRFGDAQKEAGFEPNALMSAYDGDHLLAKLAEHNERQMKSRNDASFPGPGAFLRLGDKKQVLTKMIAFCSNNDKYAAILEPLNDELTRTPNTATNSSEANSSDAPYGFVYLFKSGRYYKIGKTKDTVRRGSELRIQLPEKMDLIHSIQTDDPGGVETYWHKRFEAKRMNGEWFNLNITDIKMFRRWRKIF